MCCHKWYPCLVIIVKCQHTLLNGIEGSPRLIEHSICFCTSSEYERELVTLDVSCVVCRCDDFWLQMLCFALVFLGWHQHISRNINITSVHQISLNTFNNFGREESPRWSIGRRSRFLTSDIRLKPPVGQIIAPPTRYTKSVLKHAQ